MWFFYDPYSKCKAFLLIPNVILPGSERELTGKQPCGNCGLWLSHMNCIVSITVEIMMTMMVMRHLGIVITEPKP